MRTEENYKIIIDVEDNISNQRAIEMVWGVMNIGKVYNNFTEYSPATTFFNESYIVKFNSKMKALKFEVRRPNTWEKSQWKKREREKAKYEKLKKEKEEREAKENEGKKTAKEIREDYRKSISSERED